LGLGVVDQRLTLLVRLGGELDESDLLVRVLTVPFIDVRLHHARGEVFALNPGDRPRTGEVGSRAAALTGVALGAGRRSPESRNEGRALDEPTPWKRGSHL
jgi:hypothetical protein